MRGRKNHQMYRKRLQVLYLTTVSTDGHSTDLLIHVIRLQVCCNVLFSLNTYHYKTYIFSEYPQSCYYLNTTLIGRNGDYSTDEIIVPANCFVRTLFIFLAKYCHLAQVFVIIRNTRHTGTELKTELQLFRLNIY